MTSSIRMSGPGPGIKMELLSKNSSTLLDEHNFINLRDFKSYQWEVYQTAPPRGKPLCLKRVSNTRMQ